jgi:uncharacterized damage-inducible protein DinB
MKVDTMLQIDARTLIDTADSNFGVLLRHVNDLTHEESLIQPPFNGNCLNWVVGHMMQSRDKMLQLVDEPSVWTAEQIARYERNSAPITSGDDAMRFEQMLADFQTAHERLVAKLGRMTPEELAAPAKQVIKNAAPQSTGEFLNFLLWHETYHVGQVDLLRQVAGKNDKII